MANKKISKLRAPVGMKDVLPEDSKYHDYIVETFKSVAESHGYQHMETPFLENRELYEQALGEDSEVVSKELYGILKRGGEDLVLRPELKAGKARAYITNNMHNLPQPIKLYSYGPVFRYEKSKPGIYRQFTQLDIDVFGNNNASLDAEIIQIYFRLMERLGLAKDVSFQINSIGCPECQPEYIKILKDYLRGTKNNLCAECQGKITKSTFKVLGCEKDSCRKVTSKAPQAVDHLCDDCKKHLKSVLEILDELEIPYNLTPNLVRDFDYYGKTVFRVDVPETDISFDKTSLIVGGRYDGLVKGFGGKQVSALGGSVGLERLIDIMKNKEVGVPATHKKRVFLGQLGELAKRKAMKLFEELYAAGIPVLESFGRNTIKSQLKLAEKLGVDVTLIIGQKEAVEETILVRDMHSSIQEEVPLDKLIEVLQKMLSEQSAVKIEKDIKKNAKSKKK